VPNSRRDIADVDRLEFRLPTTNQREKWREPRQAGEAIEELVLRPEHDRRPQDDGVRKFLENGLLGERLAACIARLRPPVSADGGHVDQGPDHCLTCRLRDSLRALHVHGIEGLATA
jgi:hypothetical protein